MQDDATRNRISTRRKPCKENSKRLIRSKKRVDKKKSNSVPQKWPQKQRKKDPLLDAKKRNSKIGTTSLSTPEKKEECSPTDEKSPDKPNERQQRLYEEKVFVPVTHEVETDVVNELIKTVKKRRESDGHLSRPTPTKQSNFLMDRVKPIRALKAMPSFSKMKQYPQASSPSGSGKMCGPSQNSTVGKPESSPSVNDGTSTISKRGSTECIRIDIPRSPSIDNTKDVPTAKLTTSKLEPRIPPGGNNRDKLTKSDTTKTDGKTEDETKKPARKKNIRGGDDKTEEKALEEKTISNNENGGKIFLDNGNPFWLEPYEPSDDDLEGVDDVFHVNTESIIEFQEGKMKLVEMPKTTIYLDQWGRVKDMRSRDEVFFTPQIVYSNTVRSLIMTADSSDANKTKKDSRVFEKKFEQTQCDEDAEMYIEKLPTDFYSYKRGEIDSIKKKKKISIKDYVPTLLPP